MRRFSMFAPSSTVCAIVSVAFFLAFAERPQAAAQPARQLIVGTKVAPPFSIKNPDGSWSGISIELWQAIASDLGYSYEFHERDLRELIDQARDGKLDAAVAALTVTSEREKLVDFSHPFYTTGLAIAVSRRGQGSWANLIARMFSLEFLEAVAGLSLVLLALGVAIWLVERKRNPEQFGGKPASGIFSGFWWAAVTMTTVGYGDKAPVTLAGRLLAIIWMFAGIVLISVFIAAMSSALTVNQLESAIRGPEDLPRARTAAVATSTGEIYLRERRISYWAFETPIAGLEALIAGKIDAFVYDEPILRYLIKTELEGSAEVLPSTLERQDYAIALPQGSPLREPVNRILLEKISGRWWHELLAKYLDSRE